jgi:hypothetical protein
MSFGDFKSVEQFIGTYPLQIKRERLLPDVTLELPAWFMDNLDFTLATQAIQESEMFFRESFIFPFLQQAWKRYSYLKLWVNRSLNENLLQLRHPGRLRVSGQALLEGRTGN